MRYVLMVGRDVVRINIPNTRKKLGIKGCYQDVMEDISHFHKPSKNNKESVLFRSTQDLDRWLEVGDYVSYVSLYDHLREIALKVFNA